jgi:hypothetical protein
VYVACDARAHLWMVSVTVSYFHMNDFIGDFITHKNNNIWTYFMCCKTYSKSVKNIIAACEISIEEVKQEITMCFVSRPEICSPWWWCSSALKHIRLIKLRLIKCRFTEMLIIQITEAEILNTKSSLNCKNF